MACFSSADDRTSRHPYPGEHTKSDNTFMAVMIGILAALFVLSAVLVIALVIRRRQKQLKYNGSPVKLFIGHDHVNFNMADSSNGKFNNGIVYRGVASDDSDSYSKDDSLTKLTSSSSKNETATTTTTTAYAAGDVVQNRKLPSPPFREAEVAEYASTDVTKYHPSLVVNLPAAPVYKTCASREDSPPPQPPPPPPQAMCAAMGASPDLNIQVSLIDVKFFAQTSSVF